MAGKSEQMKIIAAMDKLATSAAKVKPELGHIHTTPDYKSFATNGHVLYQATLGYKPCPCTQYPKLDVFPEHHEETKVLVAEILPGDILPAVTALLPTARATGYATNPLVLTFRKQEVIWRTGFDQGRVRVFARGASVIDVIEGDEAEIALNAKYLQEALQFLGGKIPVLATVYRAGNVQMLALENVNGLDYEYERRVLLAGLKVDAGKEYIKYAVELLEHDYSLAALALKWVFEDERYNDKIDADVAAWMHKVIDDEFAASVRHALFDIRDDIKYILEEREKKEK